jgi:predicted nucleic acid-binding protein
MIGLDSCAIIDFFRGSASVQKLIQAHIGELCVSDMSYAEVLVGIKHEGNAEFFFTQIRSFPLSRQVLKKAVLIQKYTIKKGNKIPLSDCIIAASFLENGVTKLITNDAHFRQVPGLTVVPYL